MNLTIGAESGGEAEREPVSRVQVSVGVGVLQSDGPCLHLLDRGERQVVGGGGAVCSSNVVRVVA